MNIREKILCAGGLVLVVTLSLFLAQSTLGIRTDRVLRDQITDTQLRNEVTIVGIDDASLQKIGAWPWKRDVFARALTNLYLQGARLVVFDILFLEKRDGDEAMRLALENNKKTVIFASKVDKDNQLLPSVYSDSPYATSGIAHVYPDDDGKVRAIPLYQKSNSVTGENCTGSLAYKAFTTFTRKDSILCDTTLKLFLFQAKTPVTLSFVDVLNGTVSIEAVKDKVIFIGSNSLDIEDHFVGPHGEKIPGVYVHASIFTTLLNNSFLQEPSTLIYIILILLSLLGTLVIIFKLKNILIQGLLLLVGTATIIVIASLGMTLHYTISLATILFPYLLVSLYIILFRYTITEKKHSLIKELFGHYVNPKILTNILKNNNLKLGGEKKYITILFSDIRGFTTLTENMSPEELVDTLNAYLKTMSPIIMKHDGVIDKYIGDAIMAFWNAPVDVAHHEEKAVRSSLFMIEALTLMQTKTPLEIGIGLHAGEAIVGNIGSQAHINYTIIGDAVNACSRLEGLTKKYGLQIIVSEQIKQAISATDIIWRSIDMVRVKGKKEVMKLYEPMKKTPENELIVTQSNEAYSHYLNGEFTQAKELYKKLNDTYSTKMMARIESLSGYNDGLWTGIWDWDEK